MFEGFSHGAHSLGPPASGVRRNSVASDEHNRGFLGCVGIGSVLGL